MQSLKIVIALLNYAWFLLLFLKHISVSLNNILFKKPSIQEVLVCNTVRFSTRKYVILAYIVKI